MADHVTSLEQALREALTHSKLLEAWREASDYISDVDTSGSMSASVEAAKRMRDVLLPALLPLLTEREQAIFQRGREYEAAEWFACAEDKREQAIREDERRRVQEELAQALLTLPDVIRVLQSIRKSISALQSVQESR